MERTGRLEGQPITRNRPTLIIDNDSQPGLFGDAFVVFEDNSNKGMIGLPDGIGGLGLTTVEKLAGLIGGFAALLCQHLQRGGHVGHNIMEKIIAWDRSSLLLDDRSDLAVERGHRESRWLKGKAFDELDEDGREAPS